MADPDRNHPPARRAGRGTLVGLATWARLNDRRAPCDRWLASLAGGDGHVGVPVAAAVDGWVLAAWAGATIDGERAGTLLEVSVADWLVLPAVATPPPVWQWASELAAERS